MGKNKAHIRYKLKDGMIVPGATTITRLLAKPALVKWSNNLGLKGIDVNKFVDDLAEIGTLAHLMCVDHLKKEKRDYLEDYNKSQIKQAKHAFGKFLKWEKEHNPVLIEAEYSHVSEVHRFGGTIDLYCIVDGKKTLIDIKTSKGIFPEHFTQISAYKTLLEENHNEVDDVRILRIGRTEAEGFEYREVPRVDLHWKRFQRLLEIYYINKELQI